MKKRNWITAVVILVLLVLCAALWQHHVFKDNELEVMCKGSINAALEHFEEFNGSGNDSDYIARVAEFRTYMTAYLCLADGESNTDYIWCNTLYGDMTLHSEKVKAHTGALVEALEYLAEDYDHPNGFNLINALNNQLREDG